MYHFSQWLTEQMVWKATNQRKSAADSTVSNFPSCHRRLAFWMKSQLADPYHSFFFFTLRLISSNQIMLDWPLMHRSLLLCFSRTGWSCAESERGRLNLFFQLKDTSCCSAVSKSHLQHKDISANAGRALSLALLWYIHTVFTRQGYLCLLSTAECLYHLFWMAARDSGKSQEICFQNPVTLLSKTTVFACSFSQRQTSLHHLAWPVFFLFFIATSLHLNVISLAEHPHLWPLYLIEGPLILTFALKGR